MSRLIVILHPGGLGDLLLALPAIRSLKERFPSHQFVLCAQAEAAEFLYECDIVDQWLSIQSTPCTALFGGSVADDSLLRDALCRCDLAVAWTRDDAGTLAAALQNGGASAVIVQSPFASTLSSLHQSDRFAEIVGGQARMASLSLPRTLHAEARTFLENQGVSGIRPLVLVHPGSGSRHKCVGPEILSPVLEMLDSEGFEPLLLEGPADHGMVEPLVARTARRPILLSGLSLRLLAGVLSQVELFLGHDSGVSHLAALLGTPTVALFGPTDPARWAPQGPTVTVMQAKGCSCVSWEAVKACMEKPCLKFSSAAIMSACRKTAVTPRNS